MDEKLLQLEFLRCPTCYAEKIEFESKKFLVCGNCNEKYPIFSDNSAALLRGDLSKTKNDIQAFWGDTCKQWYDPLVGTLDAKKLIEHLDNLKELFTIYKHLAVTEMNLRQIKGLRILEVGSGGGGHSALFKHHGADVTSIDITPARVFSTAKLLTLLAGNSGAAFNADAENLPFQDNAFDLVYSNGVIHHSENTEKCLAEIFRVLKPGGKAIIMLYSRHSATYWLNLVVHGILSGDIFKYPEAEWIGRMTEGRPKYQETKNSITRVYSKKEIFKLFRDWRMLSLRKGGFVFSTLPIIGRLRAPLLKLLGHEAHPGGLIVYGCSRIPATKLELFLDKYFGWTWNIFCQKSILDRH